MFKVLITNENFGLPLIKLDNPEKRIGARGIVLRNDGKIAILHKVLKNEYKLIGGGVDEGETFENGFLREVLEETGCVVKIVRKLGITEEYRSSDNFVQISHVFESVVEDDSKHLNLTDKEIDEGARLLWLDINEAYDKISKSFDNLVASSYENLYHTKFIVLRDKSILEEYMKGRK